MGLNARCPSDLGSWAAEESRHSAPLCPVAWVCRIRQVQLCRQRDVAVSKSACELHILAEAPLATLAIQLDEGDVVPGQLSLLESLVQGNNAKRVDMVCADIQGDWSPWQEGVEQETSMRHMV